MMSLRSCILTFAIVTAAAASAADLTATDIMQKNFVATRVQDSVSEATLTLISGQGDTRKRTVASSSILAANGIDNTRLTRFTAPADAAGMATLTDEHMGGDDNIWVYLPAMRKTRRIQSADKGKPFLGTDFSYGDIMGLHVGDWTYGEVKSEACAPGTCYTVMATAKTPAVTSASGYAKRKLWIDQKSFVSMKMEGYDAGGQLIKRVTASDVKLVDAARERYQPMRIVAENVLTAHKTEIHFTRYDVNVGVKPESLSVQSLESAN